MEKVFLYRCFLLLSVSFFIIITNANNENIPIQSLPVNPPEQSYVVMNFYINQDGLIDQTFNTDQHDIRVSTKIKIKDFLEKTSLWDILKSYYVWGVAGFFILFIIRKKLVAYVQKILLEKASMVNS